MHDSQGNFFNYVYSRMHADASDRRKMQMSQAVETRVLLCIAGFAMAVMLISSFSSFA